MKFKFFTLILIICSFAAHAQSRLQSINGEWFFALDPLKIGVEEGWTKPGFAGNQLDKVNVPHSFSVDPRYFFYTGTAWYFKKFDLSTVAAGNRVQLKFDAVFYKCSIWLNGTLVGRHEGGYTPFEIDITPVVKRQNVLSVMVDNSWDRTTIPGAKTTDTLKTANASQVFPWINYGGITKKVSLSIRPNVQLQKLKVETEPDLKNGTAALTFVTYLKNDAQVDTTLLLSAVVSDATDPIKGLIKSQKIKLLAGEEKKIVLGAILPARSVILWSPDQPYLYHVGISIGTDTVKSTFGIRKVEVKGTKLLLNGNPVKFGGANRPSDYPGLGSLDPDSVLIKDLVLMKSAGMEFSRIGHHAVSTQLLDWADKNGMLLITEAGNWQMTTKQMDDSLMRSKFRSQYREMIERDWNHPSVIAYSLGNEFYSNQEAGKAWVRDMKDFTKKIDNTRLITFASHMVFRDYVKKPEDDASQYVDFISTNIYSNHRRSLAHIHELYPDKPVYISEFGMMLTAKNTEQDRIGHFRDAIAAFRENDYVIGASVWTFNDYLSRFPQTNPDGYRSWGLVSAHREPRESYYLVQNEFAPATIGITGHTQNGLTISVKARTDFPVYTLKGYQLKIGDKMLPIKDLQPGQSQEIQWPLSQSSGQLRVMLIKPGAFVVINQLLKY